MKEETSDRGWMIWDMALGLAQLTIVPLGDTHIGGYPAISK